MLWVALLRLVAWSVLCLLSVSSVMAFPSPARGRCSADLESQHLLCYFHIQIYILRAFPQHSQVAAYKYYIISLQKTLWWFHITYRVKSKFLL